MESKPRLRSLSRSQDFQRLKTQGKVIHVNSWLLVNLQKTELGQLRAGWTIPRQVGTAVVRNRLKRWGREFLRQWCRRKRRSLDLNVVLKRRDKEFYRAVSHEEFDGAMDKMVRKIELL